MPTIKKINLNGVSYDLGGGLTEDVKQASLQIAEKVSYIDEHGQQYYDDLYDAFYDNTWNVTNTLSNASTSNPATKTAKDGTYTAIISANTGYTLDGATVQVTMGGANVTSVVYSNGTIFIPAVTGDVVITVVAVALTVVSISAVYTQSGTVLNIDKLDSLKSDLVVMAEFNDNSSSVIPSDEYTLSGSLTAGTSTITVTYDELTTTFNVTVTDSGYLYYWDFTDSLTDRVNGVDASVTACGIEEGGIEFSEAASLAHGGADVGAGMYHTQSINLGNVFGRGKSLEIDLINTNHQTSQTYSKNLISLWNGVTYNDGGVPNQFGFHYSTTATNNRFGFLASDVAHWAYNKNTSIGTPAYLDGNHTIKLDVSASGVVSVYLNGTDMNLVYNGAKPTITDAHASHVVIGSFAFLNQGNNVFQNCVVTGARIKSL